ncbi:hypothetical protein DSUL_100170 [Desulfovibrionales bacterium]
MKLSKVILRYDPICLLRRRDRYIFGTWHMLEDDFSYLIAKKLLGFFQI